MFYARKNQINKFQKLIKILLLFYDLYKKIKIINEDFLLKNEVIYFAYANSYLINNVIIL